MKMPPKKKARVDADATEANLSWTVDDVVKLPYDNNCVSSEILRYT